LNCPVIASSGLPVNRATPQRREEGPVWVSELLKTDVVGMDGKEIIVRLVEFAIIVFP